MGGKILVLGSANVDLILRTPRFHHPGETVAGEDLVTAFGGKGANQAFAARKLGGKVILITKLGNDSFGRNYRRHFLRNGFTSRTLLQDAHLPTGVALIQIGPGGENRIIVSPGANASLTAKDVKRLPGAWKGVQVFVSQLEIPIPAVKAGLEKARRQGILTVLNPAPAVPLSREVYRLVDYLVPNEGEAEKLAGANLKNRRDLGRVAGKLLEKGAKNVVITLGREGLFFKNREEEIRLKAFPVKAVDTTAAGDAFVGALACGLAEGRPLREILRRASAAGALAATRLGAQPSLPNEKELKEFLRKAAKTRSSGEAGFMSEAGGWGRAFQGDGGRPATRRQ